MTFLPKPPEDREFQLAPAGNHQAVCVGVLDLGTQETEREGQVSSKRQVQLIWELVGEEMEDGRPFTIRSKRYTWSTSKKAALRKDLESWRGQPFKESDFGEGGFDIRKLLGANCMLNVIHRESGDRTYANVGSISPLAKGMAKAEPVGDTIFIWLDKSIFDWDCWEKLGQGTQILIANSPEFKIVRGDVTGLESAGSPGRVEPPKGRRKQQPILTEEDVPF